MAAHRDPNVIQYLPMKKGKTTSTSTTMVGKASLVEAMSGTYALHNEYAAGLSPWADADSFEATAVGHDSIRLFARGGAIKLPSG